MPIERIIIDVPDESIPDLVTWLPLKGKVNDFEPLDWMNGAEKLISTHPKNNAILQIMDDMISSAEHSVFLCNWMLNYPGIEKSLVEAADRLNGRVHVLTTLGTSIFSRYSNEEQAEKDLERLQSLAGDGVYIRLHTESHAKFLIADDELLITSANIVKTSLEENIETGIRVNDTNTVASLRTFFSYLWLHEAKQHIRPSKNDPRLGSPWTQSNKPDAPLASANAIWTLSDRRTSLSKGIIDTIKSAKKSLRISTYALSNAESGIGKKVVDELVAASRRGIAITVLYHAAPIAIGRPPREHEKAGFLRLMSCNGVSIRGHPDLHAKHVIADDSSGLIFTANLDGNHGLNTGIEVGVRLSKEASQHLSVWHDSLFDAFPLELVISPSISELSNRGGTKLVRLPSEIVVPSLSHFEEVKQVISKISEKTTVICKRINRWIEPENKGGRWIPKPYESRIKAPSIDSGFLLDGLNLFGKGKHAEVEISEDSDFGLHHAHIAPGRYKLSLIKQYTDDEILQLIEQHLPAPEGGIPLKEILAGFKENISSTEEIPFELDDSGFSDYIQRNMKRGLLRAHEIKGKRIFQKVVELDDEKAD